MTQVDTTMVFYRYKEHGLGEEKLELLTFTLEKETPKGYWIKGHYAKKWVSKTSHKKFAYLTKEEALSGFVKRKKNQVKILTSQLEFATKYLQVGENTILW